MFAAIRVRSAVRSAVWGTALSLFLGTLGFNSTALAGHPWGGGHGLHHHGHYHGFGYAGYRSLSIYPTSVWAGGYGWSGYRGLSYSRTSYSPWGYREWYVRPAGYSSFYANYHLPMTIYPRIGYYAPSTALYIPDYYGYQPGYCLSSAFDYDPGLVAPVDTMPADCATCGAASEIAPGGELLLSSDASEGIPAELLASADAIFQAGGYQQAAAAYAQLHVRYGSSNLIFGRRFVAQVACGDYDQAAVVLVSAQGAGFPIERSLTSISDWNNLLAPQAEAVQGWTERLAQHALQSQAEEAPLAAGQREALELMATWLNLTGQPERAGLFLAMAERLAAQENLPESSPSLSPSNESPITLATTQAARNQAARKTDDTQALPSPPRAASKLVLRQE